MNTNSIFIESVSPFDFDTSVEKLKNAIAEAGWKTPAIHDLQQTMKNFGKEVLPVHVFEICHPKHSSRILEQNDERIASAMMPCRISVYEKQDGNTYISRINSGILSVSIGGLIAEVMKDATEDLEIIVSKIIS